MEESPLGSVVISLAVMIGILMLARRVTLTVFPGSARFLEQAGLRAGRAVVKGILPMQRREIEESAKALTWFIAFACLVTLAGMAAVCSGQIAAGVIGGVATAIVWLIAFVWWRGLRRAARERFTPRPLPTRRERR